MDHKCLDKYYFVLGHYVKAKIYNKGITDKYNEVITPHHHHHPHCHQLISLYFNRLLNCQGDSVLPPSNIPNTRIMTKENIQAMSKSKVDCCSQSSLWWTIFRWTFKQGQIYLSDQGLSTGSLYAHINRLGVPILL